MSTFDVNPFTGKLDMIGSSSTSPGMYSEQQEATAGQTVFTIVGFTPNSQLTAAINDAGPSKTIIHSIVGQDVTLKVALNEGDQVVFQN